MRILAAHEKSMAADHGGSAALKKRLEAAGKRMAAIHKKLAAQPARSGGRPAVAARAVRLNSSGVQLTPDSTSSPVPSLVDDLFRSAPVSVKSVLASRPGAARQPHA
jgi:hypothetical protein